MNRQQVLSRLAERGWPVVYSHGALSVWDRGALRWEEAGWLGDSESVEGLVLDHPGLLLPRWQRYPLWDRFVVRRHARRLRNFVGEAPICYVFHPAFWPYVNSIGAEYVVYHAYDSFDLTDDWNDQLASYQARLAHRANLLIVSAQGMTVSLPPDLRPAARVLPNGADVKRFIAADDSACPADLAAVPHPRIGYAGALNVKIDFELILEVARERPDYHWVFLGVNAMNTTEGTRRLWRRCQDVSNIHYLGSKPHLEVPAYLHHMDVNVMCYRAAGRGWWLRGYPLKLHEQLAVGKPVVSAPLEAVRPFAHVVDLAQSPADWLAALDRAVTAGGVGTLEQRRAVARENTWDKRIDLLESWLFEMLQGSDGRAG